MRETRTQTRIPARTFGSVRGVHSLDPREGLRGEIAAGAAAGASWAAAAQQQQQQQLQEEEEAHEEAHRGCGEGEADRTDAAAGPGVAKHSACHSLTHNCVTLHCPDALRSAVLWFLGANHLSGTSIAAGSFVEVTWRAILRQRGRAHACNGRWPSRWRTVRLLSHAVDM